MSEAARRVDQPEPGFFRRKLVKGGPWVPARIDLEAGIWSVTIDGKRSEPSEDPTGAGVFDVWLSGERIAESEYRYLTEMREWAEKNAPHHPAANPRKPIRLSALPPVYQPRRHAV